MRHRLGVALRILALALAYSGTETVLNLKGHGLFPSRALAVCATLGAIPLLCGALGGALGLSLAQTQSAVLVPASVFSLLALPFLVLDVLSQARSPWAGSLLHVALTGAMILGSLLGAQAICVLTGWSLHRRLRCRS